MQYSSQQYVFGMCQHHCGNIKTQGPSTGIYNPLLLQIPPLILHGFKCIGSEEAMVINCPTETYNYENPDEFRVDAHVNDIPYEWGRKDG